MALRLLTTEQIMMLSACPKCDARIGKRCDAEQLKGRSESHAERQRAARHAEYQRELDRDRRKEILTA